MSKVLLGLLLWQLTLYGHASRLDQAVFAGGCFWCMEAAFQGLPGVTDVISGFTGGARANPTYNGDHQGHYEAIEVSYDASRISYQDLLEVFWTNIDPFDARGQFCDRGSSYRSALFTDSPQERQWAQISKRRVSERFPGQQVVTPILDRKAFYPVENHHQDYFIKHALRYRIYRACCGRDRRLRQIWGDVADH